MNDIAPESKYLNGHISPSTLKVYTTPVSGSDYLSCTKLRILRALATLRLVLFSSPTTSQK